MISLRKPKIQQEIEELTLEMAKLRTEFSLLHLEFLALKNKESYFGPVYTPMDFSQVFPIPLTERRKISHEVTYQTTTY
jgi:hypothetical protein